MPPTAGQQPSNPPCLLSLGRRLLPGGGGAGRSWGLGAWGPQRAPAQLFLQVQHVAVALRVVSCLGLHKLMEAAKVVHLRGGGGRWCRQWEVS